MPDPDSSQFFFSIQGKIIKYRSSAAPLLSSFNNLNKMGTRLGVTKNATNTKTAHVRMKVRKMALVKFHGNMLYPNQPCTAHLFFSLISHTPSMKSRFLNAAFSCHFAYTRALFYLVCNFMRARFFDVHSLGQPTLAHPCIMSFHTHTQTLVVFFYFLEKT